MYWNILNSGGGNYGIGWIVTLDVLKSYSEVTYPLTQLGWIVTLDVLK